MGRERDKLLTYHSPENGKYEVVVARSVAGQPGEARRRIADAIERLGLHVIEDDPVVVAKRPPTGWGAAGWDNDILANPATLEVHVKANGPNASVATFTYLVSVPLLFDGDARVLRREVDAIVAIAEAPADSRSCAACGSPTAGDAARFCRSCGAQLGSESPVEIEALHATAAANAAYTSLLVGTTGAIIAILLMALVAAGLGGIVGINAKLLVVLTILASLAGLLGVGSLVTGARRLRRVVFDAGADDADDRAPARRELEHQEVRALPEPPVPLSVTEGTTDLLEAKRVSDRPRTTA